VAVVDGFPAPLTDLARMSSMVIFGAEMPCTGQELWRSDGSAPGTSLVHDIAAGPESSSPTEMTVAESFVFFSATGAQGRELWAVRLASLHQLVVYLPLVGR
jgi:ELWxxDGT repeat protein